MCSSSSSSWLWCWGTFMCCDLLGALGLPVQLEASVGGCKLEQEPSQPGTPPKVGSQGMGRWQEQSWCLASAPVSPQLWLGLPCFQPHLSSVGFCSGV